MGKLGGHFTKRHPVVKVLVVEDEPMLQEAYRHVLQYKGYKVYVAADGLAGLKVLEKQQPDVVLLDVLMPQLDGVGFLREAQIHQRFPHTKVIACTNLSDKITRDQLLQEGADVEVLKSDLSPGELVNLVERLVNGTYQADDTSAKPL